MACYNFEPRHIANLDFKRLFEEERRDSCFAFAFETDDSFYAARDHLGIVPLYFRIKDGGCYFSTCLCELLDSALKPSYKGYKWFIALGSPKIVPPFNDIDVVPPGSVLKIDKQSLRKEVIYQYKFKPRDLRGLHGDLVVKELDRLMVQALERTLKERRVGLYLSGGIDSALVGAYLTGMGVDVNAYTLAPWGQISSEIPYSLMNAKRIGVKDHYIDELDLSMIAKYLEEIPCFYGTIPGVSSALGIVSLLKHTPLLTERQVYFAQGADTISCIMPVQNLVWVAGLLPRVVRKWLSANLGKEDVVLDYLAVASEGLIDSYPNEWYRELISAVKGKIQKLSLAGMYLVHTPPDGDVLIDPLIKRHILVSNPFYDVDLIEFFLGLSVKYRLKFSLRQRTKVYLDKSLIKKLASAYLDKEVLQRKKGLTVPIYLNDDLMRKLHEAKPLFNLKPKGSEQMFRVLVFQQYCLYHGISIDSTCVSD